MTFFFRLNGEPDLELRSAFDALTRTDTFFTTALKRTCVAAWRARWKILGMTLSVDRLGVASQPRGITMSNPPILSSETTVRFGKVFGISLGNLILVIAGIGSVVLAFHFLQNSVESLTKSHEQGRLETAASILKVSEDFQAAQSALESKFQVALENDRKLAESERRRMELELANTKERIAGFSTIVESIRPIVAVIPVLDQRVAATERATNEFREVAADVRAQRATALEIKAELKDLRTELNAARNSPSK